MESPLATVKCLKATNILNKITIKYNCCAI